MKHTSSGAAQTRRRRVVAIITAIVGLALLLGYFLWPKADTERAQSAAATPRPRAATRLRRLRDARDASVETVPAAFRGPAPEKPVIDSIEVEKLEVCEGEENLVTVKAHTPANRDDAYLNYLVGSTRGPQVPIRSYVSGGDAAELPRQVVVFGRNAAVSGALVEAVVPAFRVKDCKVPYRLDVSHRLRPNTEADFDLTASVDAFGAKTAFEAVRYEWDFGDGTTKETTQPRVTHSYEERREETLYSWFLVRCRAVSQSGDSVVGRHSLMVMNDGFEQLHYKGIIVLRVRMTPHFPKLDPDGKIKQAVRLWIHLHQDVTIDKVLQRDVHAERAGSGNRNGGPAPQSKPVEVDASSLLGTSIIPSGGIDTEVVLDTREEPTLLVRDYELSGHAQDGSPVVGRFSIMRPPDPPTREKNDGFVRDPALVQRIQRAREVLKKPFVSSEELWQLEKLGYFSELPAP